ncbi:MAG: ZIP family metal transporter [Acidimicrobiales bacterium]
MTITLVAVGILFLSLAGGFAPRLFHRRLSDQQLQDVTGLASGLLLASALLVVIPEGFHIAAESEVHDHSHEDVFAFSPIVLGATLLVGFLAMLLLEGLGVGHAVHEEHHDHAAGHGHAHVHHPTSITVLGVGLTVHAMADGLAIGSAAVTGELAFSLLVAFAVVLHRVPAAFSLGLFALHETENKLRPVLAILMFSVATPIMIVVSYLVLGEAQQSITALALLFSAGTFVYVATVDTLPAIHNPEVGRRAVLTVLTGAAAFAIVLLGVNELGFAEHAH